MKGLLFTLFLIFSHLSLAKTPPRLTDGFWKNTKESFTEHIPLHLTAIGITPVLIYSGADVHVHNTFKNNDTNLFTIGEAAGYLAPFVVAAPFYVIGEWNKDNESLGAGFAVTQATVITLTSVSLLKSFTGRPPPDKDSSKNIHAQSREFNFGFLNRGIYDGWPSGHMATITALATTLTNYYPEKPWVKWTGYGAMAYTMLTISAHEEGQFHWFSDGVAGGLLGYAIGETVGSNWRENVKGQPAPEPEKKSVQFLPLFAPGRTGIQLVWTQ